MRRIRRITLRDFRSYGSLDLALDGRATALTGPNGAGKTNLLEALSLLGPGRGLRRATLSDMVRRGAEGGWGVGVGVAEDGEEPTSLATSYQPRDGKRVARVDGQVAKGTGALLDFFRIQWLTPAQDRLFIEGAGERRRFLDRMTMALEPGHAGAATAYEQAMRQRTAALTSGKRDDRLLTILEAQMATAAATMNAARQRTVAGLASGYEAIAHSAFPTAALELDGRFERTAEGSAQEAVVSRFAEELRQGRVRDREAGRALQGPHRADLLVRHIEKDQPARLCSTGEQKALLIGIVLAHAAMVSTQEEADLILLLDEVAAHLDAHRRAALADILETLPAQVFMTGTDRELFAPWGVRAQHLHVAEGGRVEPAGASR
jgi:DNA replication and repair protein RecF